MASIWALQDVKVAIAFADAQEFLTPLPSTPVGNWNPAQAHHTLEVRDGTRFAVVLTVDLQKMAGHECDYVEVAVSFDGFEVAHHYIPLPELAANRGEFVIKTFVDGMSGMAKTAEFRVLTTGIRKGLILTSRMATDKDQRRIQLGRTRTLCYMPSRSAESRSMFAMRQELLSGSTAPHPPFLATMAATPPTSETALTPLITFSKSQAIDLERPGTDLSFQLRQPVPHQSDQAWLHR